MLQGARRGTLRRLLSPLHLLGTFPLAFFVFTAGRDRRSSAGRRGDKELEQTFFELRDENGAGEHVPAGVHALSQGANSSQEWSDLCQAALDKLKEENAALLQRLFPPDVSGTHSASSAFDATASTDANGSAR